MDGSKRGKTNDEGLDVVPGLGLSSVGKQVHDDGTLLDGSLDREKSLSGNLRSTANRVQLAEHSSRRLNLPTLSTGCNYDSKTRDF